MGIGLSKILRGTTVENAVNSTTLAETLNFSEAFSLELVLRLVIIVLLTFIIAKIIKAIFRFEQQKYKEDITGKFIGNILICLVYVSGLAVALRQVPQLDKLTNTLIAGSGIAALAISLAAQESLNNIVSGAFIALFKPFEVGDRIRLVKSDITGTVEDITLRHTILKTYNNARLVVPNATMNQEMLENSNLIDSRASAFVEVYISYDSNLHKAVKIMADVVGNHPYYIDVRTEEEMQDKPKVEVQVREFNENSILLRANMWTTTVKDNFTACSDARIAIKERFEAAGIKFPYRKYKNIKN